MSGRHSSGSEEQSWTPSACDADRCLICGRRYPRSLTGGELSASAESYRRVQRAAAGLRLVTDRQLSKVTPSWVRDLAEEKPGTPLPKGWQANEIRRLEEEAREACPCRCHGQLTDRELRKAARQRQEVAQAAAQLKATLDRRLGRSE
jgi:hypothetical protein